MSDDQPRENYKAAGYLEQLFGDVDDRRIE